MKDDDFKLLRGFNYGRTDRQSNRWTFLNVELLLQLKNPYKNYRFKMYNKTTDNY